MPAVLTHQNFHRCVGQWVICHTLRSNVYGRLASCGGDHVLLEVPRFRPVMGNALDLPSVSHNMMEADLQATSQYTLAYGYGYGGFARAAIPLAAIVGLTVIGASALYW